MPFPHQIHLEIDAHNDFIFYFPESGCSVRLHPDKESVRRSCENLEHLLDHVSRNAPLIVENLLPALFSRIQYRQRTEWGAPPTTFIFSRGSLSCTMEVMYTAELINELGHVHQMLINWLKASEKATTATTVCSGVAARNGRFLSTL